MVRDLLLRDLSVHRRVLYAAGVLPLLMALTLGLSPGAEGEGVAAVFVIFGMVLMALLPLSLQLRERMLGTLGDLLALPVPRRDLVRLRYLEGLLGMLVFVLLNVVAWSIFQRSHPTRILEVLVHPAMLWILLIFLAYPLPFYLRWQGKGVALAYGLVIGGLYAWGYCVVRTGLRLPWLEALGHFVHSHGIHMEQLMAFGLPTLLILLCYGTAVAAMRRMEA